MESSLFGECPVAIFFCTENTVIEPLVEKLSVNFDDAVIIASEVSEDPAKYWAK